MRRKSVAAGPDASQSDVAASSSASDLPDDDTAYRKEARRSWARLIKKVYEKDPLICPQCGKLTAIIAFIDDQDVIRQILGHLRKTGKWTPPEPPPPTLVRAAVVKLPTTCGASAS